MMRSGGDNVVGINGESSLNGTPVQGGSVYPSTADSETYKVRAMIDGMLVYGTLRTR
jgi:hypothetical protein